MLDEWGEPSIDHAMMAGSGNPPRPGIAPRPGLPLLREITGVSHGDA
tara:strand:- start:1213 stop:1353 length:141 start_codon:yes stop_codon:yes gene_type:complete